MREEFKGRLWSLPAMPADCAPSTMPDAWLAVHGLPPRPPANHPAHALWQQAVDLGAKLLPVTGADCDETADGTKPEVQSWRIDMTSGDSRHRRSGSNCGAGGAPSTVMGSNNWSGAVLLANRGQRFTWITGGWTPTAMTSPEGGAAERRTSVWIGFDGLLRHNQSLPQCGVTQRIPAGGQGTHSYTAWFQWWERPPPNQRDRLVPPLEFHRFPIAAGDPIRCFLWATENGQAIGMLIVNLQTQCGLRLVCNAAAGGRTPIEGSTAEWVVERPSMFDAPDALGRHALFPLASFGRLTFAGCHAAQAGQPDAALDSTWLRDLATARYIRMRAPEIETVRVSRILSAPVRPAAADTTAVTLLDLTAKASPGV